MKPGTARALAGAAAGSLLLLLVVLYLCFGFTRPFFIALAVDSAAILSISVWAAFNYASLDRRLSLARKRAVDGEQLRAQYSVLRKAAGLPTVFTVDQLETATDRFRTPVGSGASAAVFKGALPDGSLVAVKRLAGDPRGAAEFSAEVAALAAVQHVNLLRLRGYCILPRGPRFLVYDFMENSSLDTWIFARGRFLTWSQRRDVAVDVARALAYLHTECRARVLHLDVKPENILLDREFKAHLADLGLSKLLRRDEARVKIETRGTRGYLAPEWLTGAGVSEKSDVYSFGMVLLELVTGRRNVVIGQDGLNVPYFPRAALEMVKEGREMEALDLRLRTGEEVEEGAVRKMVWVGLWCVQDEPGLRPGMDRVVEMLCGGAVVDEPPETDMVVIRLLDLDDGVERRPEALPSLYFASVSSASPR